MYVTQADLIVRFSEQEMIQRTDRANPPVGIIDGAVLDMAIADASGLIDSYIQSRYALPLAAIPEPLRRNAADIARYYLYDDKKPEAVEKAYDRALAYFKDVAAGRASLGPTESGGQATSNDGAEMTAPDRVFGRADTGFI